MVDERTPSLRGKVHGVDSTGFAVANLFKSIGEDKFHLRPKRDLFAFRKPERTVYLSNVGNKTKPMEERTAAGAFRPQGTGGFHSACWGNYRGGVPAGDPLPPDGIVKIGVDRPYRLGGDVFTLRNLRKFHIARFGVRAADAYHKSRWTKPGGYEKARDRRHGDPSDFC